MAADEQEPQNVVAVLRGVEPLGEVALRVLAVGEDRLVRKGLVPAAAAQGIDPGIAPDQDQPCGLVAGRAVPRPVRQRPQAGLLERLLGGVEIAEIAQQGRQRLRPRGDERLLDPVETAHGAALPA